LKGSNSIPSFSACWRVKNQSAMTNEELNFDRTLRLQSVKCVDKTGSNMSNAWGLLSYEYAKDNISNYFKN
jgi:hypothetical protein